MLQTLKKVLQEPGGNTRSKDTQVKNIIIHFGANHLPGDKHKDTAQKTFKLLLRIQYQFSDIFISYFLFWINSKIWKRRFW